jgi:hypothetical protein
MIGKEEFSNLQLLDFFPDNLQAKEFSKSADERGYDEEWLGGLWDMDYIPGVKFFYPEVDGSKLGGVELTLRVPEIDEGSWQGDPREQEANAVKVLAALDLPFRFRDSLKTFNDSLKRENIVTHEFSSYERKDLPWASATFHLGKSNEFLVEVLVHHAQGVLKVEVRREDLAEANELEE